jgi:hypothetical protein
VDRYLAEAIVSAQTFKATNPSLPLGIWLLEGIALDEAGSGMPFDWVGRISSAHVTSPRQWVTRVLYMSCTPFLVTLAVDSQALACSSHVATLLSAYAHVASGHDSLSSKISASFPSSVPNTKVENYWVDVAVNTKYARNRAMDIALTEKFAAPHNWMILYVWNHRTRAFFLQWRKMHQKMEDVHPGQDDQLSLQRVLQDMHAHDQLRVGRLQNNFAVAVVESFPGSNNHPQYGNKKFRSTQLREPGPCHVMHLTVTRDPAARAQQINAACGVCSHTQASHPRILVQNSPYDYSVAVNQEQLVALTHNLSGPVAWDESHETLVYDWFGAAAMERRALERQPEDQAPTPRTTVADVRPPARRPASLRSPSSRVVAKKITLKRIPVP